MKFARIKRWRKDTLLGQAQIRQAEEAMDGLRMRKKLRTRAAIQEAAVALFGEFGYDATTVEQIADRAEISATTFFRYFPSKVDLVLSSNALHRPLLIKVLVNRPAEEAAPVAICGAIVSAWVPSISAAATSSAMRTIENSAILKGILDTIRTSWADAICEGLMIRRGLDAPDDRCELIARIAIATFGYATQSWIKNGCTTDLAQVVEKSFAVLTGLQDVEVQSGKAVRLA